MSLSKEWALLSRAMYGQEFIEELSGFLQEQKVGTILECGCGDGYILQGLARRGFSGVGIDASSEMIALALKSNQHLGITYRQMNWLDIKDIEEQFDAVVCRGNSLSVAASWGRQEIDIEKAKKKIEESIGLFFQKLKNGGLLYVDTISQREMDEGGGEVEIKTENINLIGRIEYDWENKTRRTYGSGRVFGEDFSGGSIGYLLTPSELEGTVRSFNPVRVWKPKLIHEVNYDVICARKTKYERAREQEGE